MKALHKKMQLSMASVCCRRLFKQMSTEIFFLNSCVSRDVGRYVSDDYYGMLCTFMDIGL